MAQKSSLFLDSSVSPKKIKFVPSPVVDLTLQVQSLLPVSKQIFMRTLLMLTEFLQHTLVLFINHTQSLN